MISGNDLPGIQTATLALESDIESNGLVINEAKKAKNGLKTDPEVQLVHAIAVNHPTCTRINREYAKSYIELGNLYLKAAEALTVDSLEKVAYIRRKLLGSINYSKQASISPAKRLTVLLKSGDHLVLNKLESANVTKIKKMVGQEQET